MKKYLTLNNFIGFTMCINIVTSTIFYYTDDTKDMCFFLGVAIFQSIALNNLNK